MATSRVQGSYGRLLQGISQQPPAARLPGQGTDQINMIPDVVDGLKSRMGTEHIARLMANLDQNSCVYHYNRGDDIEEYFIIMKPDLSISIFDKHGNPCNVTISQPISTYLTGVTNPLSDVQFMTIGDTTFILNRKKVVKTRGDKSPPIGGTAIVYSAYAQYDTTYKILIDGAEAASYKTNTGESASDDVKTIRTEWVATKLYDSFVAGPFNATYNITRMGTSLVLSRKDGGTNFAVSTEDGAKGKDLVAIKYKVTSIDLLPSKAPAGYKVLVSPTGSKPESRYWLEAEAAEGNLVTWKETIGANITLGFDKTTMPYVIERTDIVGGIAQFTIRQGDWEDRRVGDDLTNPLPSFADGETDTVISSLFMVQNRMCFAAGEAVVMSRTSRFFDFFRFSAISAIDTDPIDIYSDSSEVYDLRHAIPMDGGTVLFSDKAQFIIPGDKPLTKANAIMRPATSFEVNNLVKPVTTGDALMFATTEGAYSGVREFYTDSITDAKKAQPITSHVNRLLEGTIIHMVASPNINRLFAITDQHPNRVYVYDWLWQGTDKVQSAWHKWEWPSETSVRAMFYSNETLYVLINRGNTGLFLEKMDMGDPLPSGFVDRIRMDRRVELTMTYDSHNEEWVSSTLQYTPTHPELLEAVIKTGWDAYIGGAFPFTLQGDKIVTKFDIGDTSVSHWVIFGQMYQQEYEPSPVIIKDYQDRTSYIDVPTIGLIHLNMDMYPPFSVEVTKQNTQQTRVVNKTNRHGGSLNNIVGYVKPFAGTEIVPIRGKSTDAIFRIKVLSPHTFQLRDIEWTGTYIPTRRRV